LYQNSHNRGHPAISCGLFSLIVFRCPVSVFLGGDGREAADNLNMRHVMQTAETDQKASMSGVFSCV
jgi:hypothetical protein